MSVIPVSRLSCSDLALLGNNFRPARGPGAATAARRRQILGAAGRASSQASRERPALSGSKSITPPDSWSARMNT